MQFATEHPGWFTLHMGLLAAALATGAWIASHSDFRVTEGDRLAGPAKSAPCEESYTLLADDPDSSLWSLGSGSLGLCTDGTP